MASTVSDEARRTANLRMLQRGDSAVNDICSSATHVGLYEFKQEQQEWVKKQVEGSLFLVKRSDAPRFQLVILNRNSTDNWTLNIFSKMQLQNQEPYLILRFTRDGKSVIQGIWFHNSQERDQIATMLTKAMQSLELADIDHGAVASALLSPLNLGGQSIPISHAPASTSYASDATATKSTPSTTKSTMSPIPQQRQQEPVTPLQETNQQHFVLDKKSLQLSLLSLIQDDRFLDLIHAQYLKVANARATRKPDNGGEA